MGQEGWTMIICTGFVVLGLVLGAVFGDGGGSVIDGRAVIGGY